MVVSVPTEITIGALLKGRCRSWSQDSFVSGLATNTVSSWNVNAISRAACLAASSAVARAAFAAASLVSAVCFAAGELSFAAVSAANFASC